LNSTASLELYEMRGDDFFKLASLKKKIEDFNLYVAGLPSFAKNFSRDSIISAILMKDVEMLKNQLCFCALKQGIKKDSLTGEEPGKIFHEYPGFKLRGLSTEFNACDTTALFLIGHEFYQRWTNDKDLVKKQRENIQRGVNYILSHLRNFLFIDDPKFSNGQKFALKVTYWKDAWITSRKNNEPVYPVVYTLAHIQNMRALRSAAKILKSDYLRKISEKMIKALKKLHDLDFGFYIAIDKLGPIKGISSDMLHSLFYLEKSDINDEQLKKILNSSKILETEIGYRVLEPKLDSELKGGHYSNQVVPFEQAIIHIGAKKFELKKVQEVSSRILDVLDSEPEQFVIKNGSVKKSGPDPQLWTIATKKYFEKTIK